LLDIVFGPVIRFFRTGPDRPPLQDPKEIRRLYDSKRWSIFLSLVLGYAFFYVCRTTFSVIKKPMLNEGILDARQMGQIGSAFALSYAIGKLVNGLLADRSNTARIISTGLLMSSITIIFFGFNPLAILFVVLWGLNGWFQSMGAAPCGASLSQWFSNRERGTRYGIWSTSHGFGEGVSYVLTAAIVAYFGWRWGMWSVGILCIFIAFILYRTLGDRPRTYGLPPIAEYKNDYSGDPSDANISVGRAQLEVIKNPYVWLLGISSICMYVSRYGINNWGVLYLQEAKSYSLTSAGWVFFTIKIVETIGTACCGFFSDKFFGSRRNVTTLIYGVIQITGMVILFLAPTTYITGLDRTMAPHLTPGAPTPELINALQENRLALPAGAVVSAADQKSWTISSNAWYLPWKGYRIADTGTQLSVSRKYGLWHVVGGCCFGFGLGGLLAFIGGLIAIDICSKKASGAAMGLVGMLSYFGSSAQDLVSGNLIEAGKMVVNGETVHDFTPAYLFWLGAAVLSMLIACTLWNVRQKE
jgi:OPA family sugar phosphate sensor protein UhpC-like MFS transporter